MKGGKAPGLNFGGRVKVASVKNFQLVTARMEKTALSVSHRLAVKGLSRLSAHAPSLCGEKERKAACRHNSLGNNVSLFAKILILYNG